MDADQSRSRCFGQRRCDDGVERTHVRFGKYTLKRHYGVVCFVLLAAVSLRLLHRGHASSGVTNAAQRGAPRELTFTLLDGAVWNLSDQRGHVVALNLWATWCAPCRSETPALVRTEADLGPRGFQVIGVSLDTVHDRSAQVNNFRAAYRVNYPMAYPDSMSQIESGLDGIPTTLLFDRQSRTAKIYVGELNEQVLRADVATLLSEPLPSLDPPPLSRSER